MRGRVQAVTFDGIGALAFVGKAAFIACAGLVLIGDGASMDSGDIASPAIWQPLLTRLSSFAELSADDCTAIRRVVAGGAKRKQARRDVIREGDKPNAVLFILAGWACRYKELNDGRRQIVSLLLPGDVGHADICLIDAMDHSIGAITDLRYAQVPAQQIEALIASNRPFATAFKRQELANAGIAHEWTANVGLRRGLERMAHLICELFLRLRAVGLTHDYSCDFPLTQYDLADAAGMTDIHANRMLQELRRRHLVELHDKRLSVPDLDALMAASAFNPNYLHLRERPPSAISVSASFAG